jgi:hypothetical protein
MIESGPSPAQLSPNSLPETAKRELPPAEGRWAAHWVLPHAQRPAPQRPCQPDGHPSDRLAVPRGELRKKTAAVGRGGRVA